MNGSPFWILCVCRLQAFLYAQIVAVYDDGVVLYAYLEIYNVKNSSSIIKAATQALHPIDLQGSTMGKSTMKTCIADLIGTDPRSNSGLLTGFDFPDWDIQYVLQDASVTLRKVAFTLGSARNVDTQFDGSDVIRMMASDCVRWLARPSTAVFAWICDKPSFVTIAKVRCNF